MREYKAIKQLRQEEAGLETKTKGRKKYLND